MTAIRRHLPALGLTLSVAFVVRLAWTLAIHPDPADGRFDDTVWYRGAAHFLARGEGYLNPFTGTPTAGWPPGYPAFLGATFKLFGEGVAQTAAANIAVMLLTIAVVYAMGALLFDRRTALLAAGALAVWPGQVYFASLTLSEPLFTLLFTTALLLMFVAPRVNARRGAVVVAFGIVTGAAVLTRGQALLLLPLAVVCWHMEANVERWRSAIGWGMLAAIVVGLMLAPWVVRNQQQLGSPVVIATNLGPNLWIGHHEGATGRMQSDAPIPLPDRGGLTQPEYEVEGNSLALRKGLSYMLTHPADEIRLSIHKLRAMYESDATALDWNSGYTSGYYYGERSERTLRGAANGFWFAALLVAAVGLIASRAQLSGAVGMLPLIALSWTATHLVFFGDSRFHYPVVFVFALLGARGAVVIFEALRRTRPALDEPLIGRNAPA